MSRQEIIRKATRWGGIALAFVVVALLIQPLLPSTALQRERNRVSVEERHAFVLMANGNLVLYIQDLQGCWADRPLSATSDSSVCYVDTLQGCYVNRFYALPSCRGRVLIPNMAVVDDSILQATNSRLAEVIRQQRDTLRQRERKFTALTDELDYYLEANNVTDEGYNTIATYATYALRLRERLRVALHVLDSLLPTDTLSICRVYHHALLTSSTNERPLPCSDDITTADGSFLRIQTDSRHTPAGAFARFFARPLVDSTALDAYGKRRQLPEYVYKGELKNGLREGHGVYIDREGCYYNGEWLAGRRNGFGCAVDSLGRVRVGEWKDNRYLGQRLTYTEERIYGIDISRYQHDIGKKHYAIDWSKVRISHLGTISKKRVSGTVDYPVSFCFIKATEGITIRNKYYAADYAAARRQGIRTGAYHFFSTKSSAAEQANYFLSYARFSKGDMPPVLDVEPTDAQIRAMGGPDVLLARIRTWMNAVEKRCGQRPILYVGQNFVNKYLVNAPDIKRDYQVWIARYGEYKPDVRLAFWQLCPDGRVKGIAGTVDINVFNGYRDQYEDFLDTYTIQ